MGAPPTQLSRPRARRAQIRSRSGTSSPGETPGRPLAPPAQSAIGPSPNLHYRAPAADFEAVTLLDELAEIRAVVVSRGVRRGAKFWLRVMNELKVRGTQNLLIAVVDGLKGFPEAITTVFPDCVVQTRIVHLIRYSLQFASWKERKPLAKALRAIYGAASTEAAGAELDRFEAGPFGERYAAVVHSWRRRWTAQASTWARTISTSTARTLRHLAPRQPQAPRPLRRRVYVPAERGEC